MDYCSLLYASVDSHCWKIIKNVSSKNPKILSLKIVNFLKKKLKTLRFRKWDFLRWFFNTVAVYSGDKRQQLLLVRLQNFHRSLVFLYFMGNNFSNAKRAICKGAFLLLLLPTHDKKKICLQATICKTGFALIRCLQPLHHNGWKISKNVSLLVQIVSKMIRYQIAKKLMRLFLTFCNPCAFLFFPEHHRASRVNKPKTVLLGIDAGFKLLNWPT